MSNEPTTELAELERYAGGKAPHGHAARQQALQLIGAQEVARTRDDPLVLRKVNELAAAAADDWYYRFPVRTKTGQDWIEGASIKCALAVARLFGNCHVGIREIVDTGDHWLFKARFVDLETGFSLEKDYYQRKGQVTMNTKDPQRAQDIVFQIGQSKALRNVVTAALGDLTDRAWHTARDSIVHQIGNRLEEWRERILQRLDELPVELARVERVIGTSHRQWIASDIARVVAMYKACADGMATIDETFPPLDRGALVDAAAAAVGEASPAGGDQASAGAPSQANAPANPAPQAAGAKTVAGSSDPPSPDTHPVGSSPSPPRWANNPQEYFGRIKAKCLGATDPQMLRGWFASDQERKVRTDAGMSQGEIKEARAMIEVRCAELERK